MISNQSQDGNCINLEGEVTINDAAQLKETLLNFLSTQAQVTINLAGITKIDTSGLQLLYAAHQTAVHQGKKCSMENPSPAFMQAAKLAGLFFQSPEGYLEGCLWQGAPVAEVDLVRTGTLSITPELIDLLLRSRDQIQMMLYASDSELEDSSGEMDQILTGLQRLQDPLSAAKPTASFPQETRRRGDGETGRNTLSPCPPVPQSPCPPQEQDQVHSQDQVQDQGQGQGQRQGQGQGQSLTQGTHGTHGTQERLPPQRQVTYRLRIKLNPKIMATALDPLCLLRELQSMGDCAISAQTDQVPWLEEMDPEGCCFYWDAIINTRASREELEGIFLFVQDESQISITQLGDEFEDEAEPKKIGEILVERGDVTLEQVRQILARQKRSGELMVEAGLVSRSKVESALIEQKMFRQLRDNQPNADTIRVSIKKLDRLINLVGEMVITQAQLSQTCACHRGSLRYQDTDLLTAVESMERLTNELRDCALNIRMLPIETTFGKFRRLVHDLSASLGKEAELVTEGGE